MKITNVFKSLTLLTIVFFFCALSLKVNAQVPDVIDAKVMAKRYLKYGKIEVTESKMEKEVNVDGDYGTIIITGTAIYTPAKIGKKEFKDIQGMLVIDLYDKAGNKLMKSEGIPESGENGQAENVKYKEPFPFVYEDIITSLDKFDKIDSHKVRVWWILQ